MPYIKHPYRWLRKQMRMVGVRCVSETKDGANLLYPDGKQVYVLKSVSPGAAVHMVSDARHRAGFPGRIPIPGEGPRVSPDRVIASAHAIARFKLMQSQAAVTLDELEAALLRPEIRQTSHNGQWIFTADRVALVLAFDEDGTATIITVLWGTDELREQYPRPENEMTPAATGV